MRRLRLCLSVPAIALAIILAASASCAQQQSPAQPQSPDSGQQGYSFMFGPMNGPMMQGAIMFGPGRGMAGPGHGAMAGSGTMGGMTGDPTRHIEGRIAFVKTELGITEAQTRAWNAFADAWRASAKKMAEAMQSAPGGMSGAMSGGMTGGGMMSGAWSAGTTPTLPDQIAWMEAHASAHLEALRMMKGPATQLHAALSDEQKREAAGLLHGPMGLHGMMGWR